MLLSPLSTTACAPAGMHKLRIVMASTFINHARQARLHRGAPRRAHRPSHERECTRMRALQHAPRKRWQERRTQLKLATVRIILYVCDPSTYVLDLQYSIGLYGGRGIHCGWIIFITYNVHIMCVDKLCQSVPESESSAQRRRTPYCEIQVPRLTRLSPPHLVLCGFPSTHYNVMCYNR